MVRLLRPHCVHRGGLPPGFRIGGFDVIVRRVPTGHGIAHRVAVEDFDPKIHRARYVQMVQGVVVDRAGSQGNRLNARALSFPSHRHLSAVESKNFKRRL